MPKTINVNNLMQKNYSYESVDKPLDKEPYHKEFKPEITLKEALKLGIMGGKYFNDVAATSEYPKDLFKDAKLCGVENHYDPEINYYKTKCGSTLKEWKAQKWIDKEDPRGFIEWWARYSINNRRIPEIDEKQIKRWKNAGRFIKSAISLHKKKGVWSKALLQSALHWGYDPRKYLKM